MINFIEKNNLLSDCQHGFRSGRSTETAVLQFISNVYKHLEKKHYLAGVFMDISKAFDSPSHEIILYKLNNFGIRGIPLDYWIKHNKLRLNVSKTNYIFIQNHSIKFVMPPVTIERITLNKVDRIKFLTKILIGIIR